MRQTSKAIGHMKRNQNSNCIAQRCFKATGDGEGGSCRTKSQLSILIRVERYESGLKDKWKGKSSSQDIKSQNQRHRDLRKAVIYKGNSQ